MRLTVQIVLLVATLGWLALIVFSSALAVAAPAAPRREVVQEQRSPSGQHVATLVEVSGGGAAGYQYQEVALHRGGSTAQVQVATRLYGVTLRWLDDQHLQVSYGSGKVGRTEVDGVAVHYRHDQR